MMKIYIDSADLTEIRRLNDYYPITGVTTNPSILVKSKSYYLDHLKEIRKIIGEEKELFVQVLGSTAQEMIEETHFIREEIAGEVIVKIPATEEGIKAVKSLSKEGIPTLVTTIYTGFQALVAALAGAKYVAPYVNRIDNLAGDGIQVVKEIQQLFTAYQLDCEILAASFKNVQQIYQIALVGADAITASPDLIEKFLAFPATATDVIQFENEWKAIYGNDGTSLKNSHELK